MIDAITHKHGATMYNEYLEFEKPIAELIAQIHELRTNNYANDKQVTEQIATLEQKNQRLTQNIYNKLDDHQIMQVARHPLRPHSSDYLSRIFEDFQPLSGDRHSGKAQAIIGGIARLNGLSVMVIAQEKGRETEEKIARNFGMPKPECYRFAHRLLKLAEKFSLPVITLIDTAGAYPGIDAEKNNQSEAIAQNIFTMCQLKTPILSVIIGEGGSGGALAIGVADVLLMMQYSVFSVISPEGCASILWKDSSKSKEAAMQMQVTAEKLKQLGLIDTIVAEPTGGAHRNINEAADHLKAALQKALMPLIHQPHSQLLDARYKKYRSIKHD